MAPFRAPVVYRVADTFAVEDFGEPIGGTAVFPGAGAGDEVDVAGGELLVVPRIGEIGEVVDWIVKVEVVVVHAIHETSQVVDAGHSEATLKDVGVSEKRVGSVIGTEGRSHGGDGDAGLARAPNEGDDFFAEVGVKDRLHVAAVKRVCGFVVETQTVDGIHGVELDPAGINERSKGSDHALAPEFPFVTSAGGKAEQWRSPVAVHDDAEVEAETRGMPAMIFAFHCVRLRNAGRKVCQWKSVEANQGHRERGAEQEPAAPEEGQNRVDLAQTRDPGLADLHGNE